VALRGEISSPESRPLIICHDPERDLLEDPGRESEGDDDVDADVIGGVKERQGDFRPSLSNILGTNDGRRFPYGFVETVSSSGSTLISFSLINIKQVNLLSKNYNERILTF
jgi:hypothetical protein